MRTQFWPRRAPSGPVIGASDGVRFRSETGFWDVTNAPSSAAPPRRR